jgi:hypothetical protein
VSVPRVDACVDELVGASVPDHETRYATRSGQGTNEASALRHLLLGNVISEDENKMNLAPSFVFLCFVVPPPLPSLGFISLVTVVVAGATSCEGELLAQMEHENLFLFMS